VAGTTGEGPVLTDQEMIDLWRAVVDAVTVPVVAGTGTNDTAHSIALTRAAGDAGVQGVLVVTPYYSRPSQAGLSAHFRAVAGATKLPVLLYDIPVRSGRRIATDLLIELGNTVGNIVGVKDATADAVAAARVVAETPDDFELYSGDDAMTLPLLAVGGVGIISVAAHWAGALFVEMVSAFLSGDLAGARQANVRLFESYQFESSETFPNPMPAKAACRALGLPVGQCRLPNVVAPSVLDEQARQVVERVGRATSGASVRESIG
jgi:4-hydroxy-tetrahydrodipicolinate synthase